MTSPHAGVHEEFVKVIQGASSLYRLGSDRIANAEQYLYRHAPAMLDFNHPELHPDSRAMWRRRAAEIVRPSDLNEYQLGLLNEHRSNP